jgi:hypothetical protein
MSRILTISVAAMLLLAVNAARGDNAPVVADVSACLVKPRLVIQLGSPVFGLLSQVLVDRAAIPNAGYLAFFS